MLDIQSALQWVQMEIAAFGGDKDRVGVFGQSSGAQVPRLPSPTLAYPRLPDPRSCARSHPARLPILLRTIAPVTTRRSNC